MRPHVPGEGHVAASTHADDEYLHTGNRHVAPHATDFGPLLSSDQQSKTQNEASTQREYVGTAPSIGEEVDEEDHANIDFSIAAFPGASRVSSTGTLETSFLVDENLVPIKIEKIPGIYKMF